MDLSNLTDEQLLQLEQQQTQSNDVDLKSLSNEELLNLEAQYSQNIPGNIEVQTVPEQKKSPLGFLERMDLSFADDEGRKKRLEQQFKIVEKLPNGKYAVGNSLSELQPIDPEGMFNDILGDLADVVAIMPTIIGQSVGGSVGGALSIPTTGGVAAPGAIVAGAGVGSMIGEAISRGIGKIRGVDLRKKQEVATDIVVSGIFGSIGEGIGQLIKFGGQGLSKVAAKSIDKALKSSKNPKLHIKALAKIFRVTAAVPEKDTIAAGIYGFDETLTDKYSNPKYVRTLINKFVEGVTRKNKALGKMVGIGDDWAKFNFGNTTVEIAESGIKLLNSLSDDSIGLIDNVGALNRGAFTESSDYRTLKQLTDLFFDVDSKTKQLIPKDIKLSQAIDFKKRTGTALKNYFKSGRVNPKAERVIAQYMNEVSESIAKNTSKLRPELNPYIKANSAFSNWKKDLSLLKANGLDLEDISGLQKNFRIVDGKKQYINKNILSFAENLEKKNSAVQEAFDIISNQINVKFPGKGIGGSVGTLSDELAKWNAAQGFVGANPSLLRLGAIAGLTGISLGSGEPGSAAKRLSLGLLLGTPIGAKLLLKSGSKAGKLASMTSLQKLMQNKTVNAKILRALISQSMGERSKNK